MTAQPLTRHHVVPDLIQGRANVLRLKERKPSPGSSPGRRSTGRDRRESSGKVHTKNRATEPFHPPPSPPGRGAGGEGSQPQPTIRSTPTDPVVPSEAKQPPPPQLHAERTRATLRGMTSDRTRPRRPIIALTAAAAALVLAGCTPARVAGNRAAAPAGPETARTTLSPTEADRGRLRDWYGAWEEALRAARAAGYGAAIEAEGALLQPLAAQTRPVPPPGDYRCRTIKLGAKQPGLLPYIAYPWFRCRVSVEGGVTRLVKLTGSQRLAGEIAPPEGTRARFLGTLALGDETTHLPYGRDPTRDIAGWVERIGEGRWRVVQPRPAFESVVDVLEIRS